MFVKQGDKTYTFSDQMPYFYSDNKLRSPLLQVFLNSSLFENMKTQVRLNQKSVILMGKLIFII